jgi:hypothetical protein
MMGVNGAHHEKGKIDCARIRPPPLAASDLIVQDVLDQISQDPAARGELEMLAVNFGRTAIVEADLEIALVESF